MNFAKWLEGKEPKRILIIMRGIPGSGKSTTAREILKQLGGGDPGGHIFSADNEFIPQTLARRAAGIDANDEFERTEYRANWHQDKLFKAHMTTLDALKNAMANGVTPLVYDNQNPKARDARAAALAAREFGYEIKVQEPTSEWWLDHSHMFKDKKANATALDNFARFLAGENPDMARRYGKSPDSHGNQHGVPLHTIQKTMSKWQPNLSVDDILGQSKKG